MKLERKMGIKKAQKNKYVFSGYYTRCGVLLFCSRSDVMVQGK